MISLAGMFTTPYYYLYFSRPWWPVEQYGKLVLGEVAVRLPFNREFKIGKDILVSIDAPKVQNMEDGFTLADLA